jgi:hypothetical protein
LAPPTPPDRIFAPYSQCRDKVALRYGHEFEHVAVEGVVVALELLVLVEEDSTVEFLQRTSNKAPEGLSGINLIAVWAG